MFDFLALFLLLIQSVGLAILFNCKIGKTFPLTVLVIIFVEYVFGYIDHLEYGFIFLIIFTAIMGIYSIINLKKIKKTINFAVLIFLVCTLVIFLIHHKNSIALTWDELAQWAVTVKYSYKTNYFAAHYSTNSIYPDYPPGTALFHYWWMKIGDGWYDNRIYISMCMMICSFITPVFDNIKGRKFAKKSLSWCALLVVILSIYPAAYKSLTVDCIMGIIFAFLLYTILFENNTYIKFCSVFFGVFGLTAIKKSAILFVGFALLIWIIDIVRKKEKREFFPFLVSVFGCVLSKQMWQNYILKNNTTTTFNIKVEDLEVEAMDWQISGVVNYFRALVNINAVGNDSQTVFYINHLKVSFVVVFLILGFCFFLIAKYWDKEKKNMFVALLLEGVVYVFATAYLYYHSFGEGEVAILSSMNRYLGTYLVGGMLLICYIVVEKVCNNEGNIKVTGWLFLFTIFLFGNVNSENIFLYAIMPEYSAQIYEKKENMKTEENKANWILERVESNSKMHIFNGDIAGMNYMLTPIAVKSPLWASGDFSYFETFAYMYNYVFLDNQYGTVENEAFIEQNGHFFVDNEDIMDFGLYKVIQTEQGAKLKFVDKYVE